MNSQEVISESLLQAKRIILFTEMGILNEQKRILRYDRMYKDRECLKMKNHEELKEKYKELEEQYNTFLNNNCDDEIKLKAFVYYELDKKYNVLKEKYEFTKKELEIKLLEEICINKILCDEKQKMFGEFTHFSYN
jgi:hypothetical protein